MTGCITGRRRFRDDDAAQSAIADMRKRPRDVMPVRSYPCTFCNGVHITKDPGHGGKPREIILKKEFEKYLIKNDDRL